MRHAAFRHRRPGSLVQKGWDDLILELVECRVLEEEAMCLGIPGEVVELLDSRAHLAKVDVAGVRRNINIELLDEDLAPGDWVLIHVGFAMAKIDEDEAQRALASLQLMGQAYADEVQAVVESQIS